MANPSSGISEAWRYARAALAGVAIAFVMLVGAPQSPPTYLVAIGFFAMAFVLVWADE